MRKAMLFVVFTLFTAIFAVRGEAKSKYVIKIVNPAKDSVLVIREIGRMSDEKAFSYRSGLEAFIKMSNNEAAAYDPSYQLVMEVAADIKMGLSEHGIEYAKRYSESVLKEINTPRRRKKFANRIMSSEVNDRMLEFVDSKRDGVELYEGRQLAARTRARLLSLLEFLAEKHSEFLGVLNSAPQT